MQHDYLFSEGSDNQMILRFEDMLRMRSIGYFDVEEFELIAEHYTASLEFKKALLVIDEALNQHPASPSILILQSRIFFKLGKYKTALAILTSIGSSEFDADALMLEGEIRMRLGASLRAEECFTRLMDISIDDKDQCCLDIAYVYLGAGEVKMAYRYLKTGLNINPNNKDILFELALNNEEQGNTDQAIHYYNRLLDIDPYNEDAWFSLAMAYTNMENHQMALEALDFTLAIDDAFSSAYMHKGNALMRLGNYRDAIEVFERFGQLEDNRPEALVFKAECYEELCEYEQALALYDEALHLDEKLVEAYVGKGFIFQTLKDYLLSTENFLKAIEISKEDDEVWAALGENYLAEKKYNEALTVFKRSLKINPDQIDLWVHVAGIYIHLDDITNGLEAIKDGLIREPQSKELLLLFSYCLILTKQVEKARMILDFEISQELVEELQVKFPALDLFRMLKIQ